MSDSPETALAERPWRVVAINIKTGERRILSGCLDQAEPDAGDGGRGVAAGRPRLIRQTTEAKQMAETTGIAWAQHTWSPWVGCTKVSPGCDNCYAASWAKRTGQVGLWSGERRFTKTWGNLRKWNRAAERACEQRRVFPSLCDPFDNQVPKSWRDAMWDAIRDAPWLDFLLLTKRPQNIAGMLPPEWGGGWPNVWLGTTAENQTEADRRIPHLLKVPARVRFLSCEPLIGRVEIGSVVLKAMLDGNIASSGTHPIGWAIVGGESGGGARSMKREWAADLIAQCLDAGVPVFFKQVGSRRGADWLDGITGKGDDPAEWPPFFRVQQFPVPPMPDRTRARLPER